MIMDHFLFVFFFSWKGCGHQHTKGNENNFSLLPSGQFTL